MALAKADFEAAMKIHYFPAIKDQLENTTYLLSRMERYTEETGGNFLQIPVRSTRTSSIGARGDTTATTDNLPSGAKPGYDKATFTVTSQYAVVQLSGLSMRASRNPNYAVARAQARDMEDTTKDFKKDINRQLFGDGSAELCQCTATTSTSVIVSSINYPTNPTKFLYASEVIDVARITDGALLATGVAVVAVSSTTVFTLTTSIAATTAYAVYRQNNIVGTSIREMFGLKAAITNANPSTAPQAAVTRLTGNFGNIDRSSASKAFWKGNLLSNSGTLRTFSANLVEQGIDTAEIASGGVVSLLQTNHAIFRLYGSLLSASKLYEGASMNLDGGWKALSVNGLPMVKDVECPDYTIFCIDESTFYLGVLGDWAWLADGDDANILTRIAGTDQYEAVLNRDMQLMCDKPAASTQITDIAHS